MNTKDLRFDVEIVTMDAYPSSTRARKTAQALTNLGKRVEFVGMSFAGRTGRWSDPGPSTQDGVSIELVKMRKPALTPTTLSQARNIALTYLPAFARMARHVWCTSADIVVVSGAPLAPLGLIHRWRYDSLLILDMTERPGAVAAVGSATAVFSKVENLVIKMMLSRTYLATAVVQPDVEYLRHVGFDRVALLRNVPLKSWRSLYQEPEDSPIQFVSIGTIFEGRGYEMLIRAAANAARHADFTVDLYGTGREEYLHQLRELIIAEGASTIVRWRGRLVPGDVSRAYLDGHVGLVLYESDDPGNDGLSNKILECVSSGRPVLAGDLPENRTFVTENGVGWLTPMTVPGISDQLVKIVQERRRIAPLAQHCRALGDTWLNWDSEFTHAFNSVTHAINTRGDI